MRETAWDAGRLRRWGKSGVVFGFQHEDSQLEAEQFSTGIGGRALCIASGGETAFALLASGASEVSALDVNPAQLRLVDLKKVALKSGHVEWLTEDATAIVSLPELSEETVRFWTGRAASLRKGLCFSGIVEGRTRLLGPVLRWFAREPTGVRWKWGWKLLRVGISLGYAARFRARLPVAWSGRLADRLARQLQNSADDPLLRAELGLGFGPKGLPVYAPERIVRILGSLDQLSLVSSDVAGFLCDRSSGGWAMIALSNIADTMGDEERSELIGLATEHLAPGGLVVLRSIVHPVGAVPEFPELDWLPIPEESGAICPVIAIGRKRPV